MSEKGGTGRGVRLDMNERKGGTGKGVRRDMNERKDGTERGVRRDMNERKGGTGRGLRRDHDAELLIYMCQAEWHIYTRLHRRFTHAYSRERLKVERWQRLAARAPPATVYNGTTRSRAIGRHGG